MCTHARQRHIARLALAAGLLLVLAPSALAEPALRFAPEFPASEEMRARVRFWVRVFTAVAQDEVILHDRDDLRIVYDVVPLGSEGGVARVDAVRASYERVLAELAFEPPSRAVLALPSLERQHMAALFAGHGRPRDAYVRAIGRIRAQRGLREVFAAGLVRADVYLPAIRRIFREARLPQDLVHLPHVESSFNPVAVSRAGAAGLWQLTRATAERHLRIDGKVDERFHPLRSSAAAARHLAHAYRALGSWPLAVASYNHGISGMLRARAAVGTDSLDDIIRGYESATFGFASRNFYAEFLAAVHVARNAWYYFPRPERAPPPLRYVVRPGDSLWTIARRHRVSVGALVAANNLGGTRLRQGQRIVIRRS